MNCRLCSVRNVHAFGGIHYGSTNGCGTTAVCKVSPLVMMMNHVARINVSTVHGACMTNALTHILCGSGWRCMRLRGCCGTMMRHTKPCRLLCKVALPSLTVLGQLSLPRGGVTLTEYLMRTCFITRALQPVTDTFRTTGAHRIRRRSCSHT